MNPQNRMVGLDKVNEIIDNNLSKFYSSQPRPKQSSGVCHCQTKLAENQQEIGYYETQIKLIKETSHLLGSQGRNNDEKMVANLLLVMIDYINRIIELLRQNFLCECKKLAITECKVMKHKLSFIREQNQKFFRLYEEKNNQCQLLFKEIENLKLKNMEIDLRPITTRHAQINDKQNHQESSALNHCSSNLTSVKSSKISQAFNPINTSIKSVFQRDHDKYFRGQLKKEQKKNKIFYQMN